MVIVRSLTWLFLTQLFRLLIFRLSCLKWLKNLPLFHLVWPASTEWVSERASSRVVSSSSSCLFCFVCSGTVCLLLNFRGRGWFMGSAQHSKVESSRSLSTALSPSCWSATLPGCTRLVRLVCDPVSHRCWSFQFLNPLSCWYFGGDQYANRARISKCSELLTTFKSMKVLGLCTF